MPRPAGIALAALTAVLLVGCGGNGNPTVAKVGGESITQKQLDAVVGHFRSEAQREGKSFPDEKSAGFKRLRNRLLGLLVYRTELRQAADRFGLTVTDSEISKRLVTPPGSEQEGSSDDAFPRDSVASQILYERIFDRVTRKVKAPPGTPRPARERRAVSGAYLGSS
jgi:hypothetical protein